VQRVYHQKKKRLRLNNTRKERDDLQRRSTVQGRGTRGSKAVLGPLPEVNSPKAMLSNEEEKGNRGETGREDENTAWRFSR